MHEDTKNSLQKIVTSKKVHASLRNSRKLLMYDAKDFSWTTPRSSGQKVAVFSKDISTDLFHKIIYI